MIGDIRGCSSSIKEDEDDDNEHGNAFEEENGKEVNEKQNNGSTVVWVPLCTQLLLWFIL